MSYQSAIQKLRKTHGDDPRLDEIQKKLTSIKALGDWSEWTYMDIKRDLREFDKR